MGGAHGLGGVFCYLVRALHGCKERKQIASKFVSRLRGLTESQVADRGLATPNLRGYLGLRKGSDFLNVGNDLFPVHAASITAFR